MNRGQLGATNVCGFIWHWAWGGVTKDDRWASPDKTMVLSLVGSTSWGYKQAQMIIEKFAYPKEKMGGGLYSISHDIASPRHGRNSQDPHALFAGANGWLVGRSIRVSDLEYIDESTWAQFANSAVNLIN